MDLDVCAVDAAAPFGLLIRLAKDWEFVETWSSARNLVLWVPRDETDLDGFVPVVRNDEYDCALPTAARPFTPFTAPSLALALVRDMVRRVSGDGCGPFCSNFFFMSFTLARAVEAGRVLPVPVADRILGPSPAANLSSTGLEAERYIGLVPTRVPDPAGGLDEAALLFDREAGGWRALGTAEAIGSWAREAGELSLAMSTPR